VINVGFTGSREGVTEAQAIQLGFFLEALFVSGARFHHGDCVGADAYAHKLAKQLGYFTVGHPPSDPKLRAFCEADVLEVERPYLDRNKDIVDASDFMIATPSKSRKTGGTWSTVNYARKVNKPVAVINA
jgi:hypothetical protein